MLYSFLSLLLCIVMAFLVPLAVIKAFIAGFKFQHGEDILTPKKKPEKAKESDSERKRKILEANIEAYDGTSTGQIEVK